MAVEVGQYNSADDIKAAIDNEKFMGGWRHHDEAFIQVLPALSTNVRPGVARFLFHIFLNFSIFVKMQNL